ncbi:MAG: Sec-independent protein translocase protein TatB [Syntrophorhabdales bacterium]|jgi:Tat protein translocase TatB subunit
MFGIGFPELLLILVIALLVVGPSRLPQVARSIGKALGEFRRMADEVKETIENELIHEDEKAGDSEALGGEPPDNKEAALPQHEPVVAAAHEPVVAAAHEPVRPQGTDSSAHEPAPLQGTDAAAEAEPAPPHESEASPRGEPEALAHEHDPGARKGP